MQSDALSGERSIDPEVEAKGVKVKGIGAKFGVSKTAGIESHLAMEMSAESHADRSTEKEVEYTARGYRYRIVTWRPLDIFVLRRADGDLVDRLIGATRARAMARICAVLQLRLPGLIDGVVDNGPAANHGSCALGRAPDHHGDMSRGVGRWQRRDVWHLPAGDHACGQAVVGADVLGTLVGRVHR